MSDLNVRAPAHNNCRSWRMYAITRYERLIVQLPFAIDTGEEFFRNVYHFENFEQFSLLNICFRKFFNQKQLYKKSTR